jgi:pilus assembly protein CpaE
VLLTLDPRQTFHDLVVARAREASLPGEMVHASTVAEAEGMIASGASPDAVIGGPGIAMAELVGVMEMLRDHAPNCVVLAVAEPTAQTLHAALRAGLRDVLAPQFTARELAEALEAAGQAMAERPLPGRTIAVFSAKGGVGTSVLASNLVLRMSELTGAPAVLVDLDLACADQAVLHGLRPRFTIQDVADGSDDQDTEALSQALLPVSDTYVRVLAGPIDPAAAEQIEHGAVLAVLQRLRQIAGIVIVDTASTFSDTTLTVLEHADVIVLPVSLDMMSLRSLVVTLQTFARLGIPKSQLMLVAMRSDAKVGLTPDDVARATGMPVAIAVPSSREVPLSVNTATPLALYSPRSAVVRAVDELVELLTDGVEFHGAATDRGGRGRSRMSRRRGSPVEVAAPPASQPRAAEAASASPSPIAPDGPVPEPAVAEPQPAAASARRVVRVRKPDASGTTDEPMADQSLTQVDVVEDLTVISFLEPHEDLAAMPPPTFNPTPTGPADEIRSRRNRRSMRS